MPSAAARWHLRPSLWRQKSLVVTFHASNACTRATGESHSFFLIITSLATLTPWLQSRGEVCRCNFSPAHVFMDDRCLGGAPFKQRRVQVNNTASLLQPNMPLNCHTTLCWHQTRGAYPALSWPCTGPQHPRWNWSFRKVSRCLCWPVEQIERGYLLTKSFDIRFPAVTANRAV